MNLFQSPLFSSLGSFVASQAWELHSAPLLFPPAFSSRLGKSSLGYSDYQPHAVTDSKLNLHCFCLKFASTHIFNDLYLAQLLKSQPPPPPRHKTFWGLTLRVISEMICFFTNLLCLKEANFVKHVTISFVIFIKRLPNPLDIGDSSLSKETSLLSTELKV